MENTQQKIWSIIIKVIIAVGSALLGIIGGAEATALFNS
jgi:hypothetical protein